MRHLDEHNVLPGVTIAATGAWSEFARHNLSGP
jgi:hypothetical protein